jgi:hypothetical protein
MRSVWLVENSLVAINPGRGSGVISFPPGPAHPDTIFGGASLDRRLSWERLKAASKGSKVVGTMHTRGNCRHKWEYEVCCSTTH